MQHLGWHCGHCTLHGECFFGGTHMQINPNIFRLHKFLQVPLPLPYMRKTKSSQRLHPSCQAQVCTLHQYFTHKQAILQSDGKDEWLKIWTQIWRKPRHLKLEREAFCRSQHLVLSTYTEVQPWQKAVWPLEGVTKETSNVITQASNTAASELNRSCKCRHLGDVFFATCNSLMFWNEAARHVKGSCCKHHKRPTTSQICWRKLGVPRIHLEA